MQRRERKVYNVKYFSERQKSRRRRGSPAQIIALRLNDLARIFHSRYGYVLPDDDAGRDDAELAAHHLAALAHPKGRIRDWIECWAPWCTVAEQRKIIESAILNRRHWTADQLAWRLRLTREERTTLGVTTIGAIDYGKSARTKRRKERERQRKASLRRAQGQTTRAEYEAKSLSKRKPWVAQGISRASWYRKNSKRETETSPVTA